MTILSRHLAALAATAALGLGSAACVGAVSGSAHVTATAPDLVLVGPGVYVVEGYDDAVFYSNGYYWQYDGGIWYRSSYYNDGFARVSLSLVPTRVRRIDRPRAYVRYRGKARAKRIKARRHQRSKAHRNDRGKRRDERARRDNRRRTHR